MLGLLESIDPKPLGDSLSHHRLHHLVSSFPRKVQACMICSCEQLALHPEKLWLRE